MNCGGFSPFHWFKPPLRNISYQVKTSPTYGNIQELEQTAVTDIWLVAERFPQNEIPSSASEIWLDENLQLVDAVPFYRLEVRHYQLEN